MNYLPRRKNTFWAAIFIVAASASLPAQDTTQNSDLSKGPNDASQLKKKEETPGVENKRIFGIVPNYRTYPFPKHYRPISSKQKFTIASQDSFDRGTIALALLFGGEGQLTNTERSFGQGVKGFAQYSATAYGDFVIGDYLTEAIIPPCSIRTRVTFAKGLAEPGRAWAMPPARSS